MRSLLYQVIDAVVVALAAADLLSRLFLNADPQFLLCPTIGGDSKLAIVFFAGIQADGEQQSREQREVLRKYGDVIVVQYSRHRFDLEQTANCTYSQLLYMGYKRFVTIGVSLGARCAAELVNCNHAAGSPMKYVGGLLSDPIVDRFDLKPPGSWTSKIACTWYPGVLFNLLSRPFWKLFGPPPKDVDGDADPKLVAQAHDTATRWPLSGYADQIRTILWLRPVPHFLPGRTAILLSDRDQFVLPSAAIKWQACAASFMVIGVDSDHAGLPTHPQAWRDAMHIGLKWVLGQTPD